MNPKRAARWLALFLVRAYQVFLGPFFGGNCKFEPSCSHYAHQAIERFGVVRGIWLGAKRLLRCRPFSTGGYDPVPEIWLSGNVNEDSNRASIAGHSLKQHTSGVAR